MYGALRGAGGWETKTETKALNYILLQPSDESLRCIIVIFSTWQRYASIIVVERFYVVIQVLIDLYQCFTLLPLYFKVWVCVMHIVHYTGPVQLIAIL
jgi:hypothetical protein